METEGSSSLVNKSAYYYLHQLVFGNPARNCLHNFSVPELVVSIIKIPCCHGFLLLQLYASKKNDQKCFSAA